MVAVSIRTSWVVNFALFCCYRPVIYTRPNVNLTFRRLASPFVDFDEILVILALAVAIIRTRVNALCFTHAY